MKAKVLLFLFAQSVANFGEWLTFAAMGYLVYMEHGVSELAMILGPPLLLQLLVGPFAGLWVDNRPAKRVMVVVSLILAVTAAGNFIGGLRVYVVLVLCRRLLGLFLSAAGNRLFPHLVDEGHLDKASGWSGAMSQITTAMGLAAGGFLAARLGPYVFFIHAFAFVISAGALLLIDSEVPGVSSLAKTQEHSREPVVRRIASIAVSSLRNLALGLSYLKQKPTLLLIAMLFGLAHICWGVRDVIGVGLVEQHLGLPAQWMGAYAATAAVAEVLGALMFARGFVSTTSKSDAKVFGTVSLLALTLVGVALIPSVIVGFFLKFLEGLASVLIGIVCGNVLIFRAPPELRGRVSGLIGALSAVCLLTGTAMAGALTSQFSPRSAYLITGSIVLGGGVIALMSSRGLSGGRGHSASDKSVA